jgi:hypothetical protein
MANHLKMATIDSILLLHARGWSSRRIARHLGIHRDTVSRCLKQSKQARALIGSAQSKLGQAPIGSEDPVMPSLVPATAAYFDNCNEAAPVAERPNEISQLARVLAPYSLDPSNAERLWESSLRLVTRR